jgi:hypothetical protein
MFGGESVIDRYDDRYSLGRSGVAEAIDAIEIPQNPPPAVEVDQYRMGAIAGGGVDAELNCTPRPGNAAIFDPGEGGGIGAQILGLGEKFPSPNRTQFRQSRQI